MPAFPALILLLAMPGCVALQTLAYRAPDFSEIRPGASREEVEAALGAPVARLRAHGSEVEDVYEYYTTKKPGILAATSELFRALFTLGISEFRALFASDKTIRHRLRIVYNSEDIVVSLALDEGAGDDLYFNQFAE